MITAEEIVRYNERTAVITAREIVDYARQNNLEITQEGIGENFYYCVLAVMRHMIDGPRTDPDPFYVYDFDLLSKHYNMTEDQLREIEHGFERPWMDENNEFFLLGKEVLTLSLQRVE